MGHLGGTWVYLVRDLPLSSRAVYRDTESWILACLGLFLGESGWRCPGGAGAEVCVLVQFLMLFVFECVFHVVVFLSQSKTMASEKEAQSAHCDCDDF